jgi:hypothetical protein
VGNAEGRWGTVNDGEGQWCHDDERSVTMGPDGLKMVTGRYWTVMGRLRDSNGNWTKS